MIIITIINNPLYPFRTLQFRYLANLLSRLVIEMMLGGTGGTGATLGSEEVFCPLSWFGDGSGGHNTLMISLPGLGCPALGQGSSSEDIQASAAYQDAGWFCSRAFAKNELHV